MKEVITTGCKINIGLNIVEKRPDGYHNLQTIFYPVPLLDEIVIEENKADEIALDGHPLEGDPQDNLVLKTIRLLRESGYEIPGQKIHLKKNIPSGAGLGGGSSDAACVMKTMNQRYNLKLSNEVMERMIAKLGADCPFFIQEKPVYAEGIGDIFTPTQLSLQGWYLLLVKPNDYISTKEAYSKICPTMPNTSLLQNVMLPLEKWKDCIVNDFEISVFPNHPTVRRIKERLYKLGATYACMSGSGSTVFGLFRHEPDIRNEFKDHFTFVCKL